MARYAIVDEQTGLVTNTSEAEEEFAKEMGWFAIADEVAIGWSYSSGKFSPPPSEPVLIPDSVDMAQARLALLYAGITATMVDAEIAKLPSPIMETAQIEWEFRTKVRRDSQLVLMLGQALGLSEQTIDNLFIQAATL